MKEGTKLGAKPALKVPTIFWQNICRISAGAEYLQPLWLDFGKKKKKEGTTELTPYWK